MLRKPLGDNNVIHVHEDIFNSLLRTISNTIHTAQKTAVKIFISVIKNQLKIYFSKRWYFDTFKIFAYNSTCQHIVMTVPLIVIWYTSTKYKTPMKPAIIITINNL